MKHKNKKREKNKIFVNKHSDKKRILNRILRINYCY